MNYLRAFAVLAGILLLTSVFAAGKVVHVYNWSDYIADDTLAGFEKATGIKVKYEVYDSNEDLQDRLFAGRSGFDVVFPSASPFANRQVAANIYEELDKTRLPNLKHIDTSVLRQLASGDKANAHLVPYLWGTTGLGYNKTKVEAILGKQAPLNSWALIFNEANAARLAPCGISVLDEEQEALGAALLYLGKNTNTANASDITAAAELLMRVRPHIKYFHSSQYINDLANGDICVALGYSGDVVQAQQRATENKTGQVIAYSIPKEGATMWVDVMAIPRDAPHKTEAHAFINYLMAPKVIADISNHVAYANANQDATGLVDADIRTNPAVYPPVAERGRLVMLKDIDDKAQRLRTKLWTQIKSGR